MTEAEQVAFDNECATIEMRHPCVKDFLDTWGKHCGASRKVFTGHLVKMLIDYIEDREHLNIIEEAEFGEPALPKPLEILQALAPHLEEDFLLACRFLYYVKAKPVLPDHRYDEGEREFLDRPEVEDSPLMSPGSDNADDYSERARALAFYLQVVAWEAGQIGGKK